MNYEFFLSEKLLPKNFRYPEVYIDYTNNLEVGNGRILDLEPWHFYYSQKSLTFHFNGLKDRYPHRVIVPFARRRDTDDVACFEAETPSDNPAVINIHDWAGPGYEGRRRCKDFSEWLDIVLFLNQRLE